jgi:cell division septation protein DedD
MAATNQGLAMRIFLAAAAIVFAVTTAQAQSAGPSADDLAVQKIVEQLKATRTVKSDAKPAEVAPAEAKPVETAPTEAKPIDAKPAEAKPVEAKPVEAKPIETKQVESKPVEAKPAQTVAKPEKKRGVVKSRETHEQTARRLAEKYGIDLE